MKNLGLKSFIAFAVLFFLAGCAGEQKDADTLTIWHWMSDRESVFNELARRYEEETGIKVRFELYAPSETYSQRVKAAAQTDTLPDIYGILGEKRDFASFINSGYVMNLTNLLRGGTPWREVLFEKALIVNEFLPGNEYGVEPGIYGVPIDVTTLQIVYNKSLYAGAGLDPEKPPLTWKEFIDHSRALKAKNIPRFVSGFGEIWMIDALASNFAMNLMGEEKVFDTYRGNVPYTDPDWVKVFSLFKEMHDEEILVEGSVTMVNKIAEQTFANERAAYAFNGSWCVNVYRGMNPNLNYGVMLPPRVSGGHPVRIWGGAGGSFVVNDKSPWKGKAVEFLRWFTADSQQAFLAIETVNLPANKRSLAQIPPILAQFVDDMDFATHPNIYPVHEGPEVSEAFDKGIQSILIGERTPAEAAQEVQKAKEKELAKRRP